MGLFGKKKGAPVVDVREASATPAPKKLEFGYPTPCPECGERGYLDSIDLSEQTMYQHCPSCFAKWTTTEEELISQ